MLGFTSSCGIETHKYCLCLIFGVNCYFYFNQGPGEIWCDVDVVEFSYFGAPEPAPKEQLYTEIVDDLRGGDPCIGSGSQVY